VADIIYPRSPRETMCGWMHLPRFIDKIRLHLAGRLPADYQANYGKGFDALWLERAGVKFEDFVKVVQATVTDGEVADWVLHHVKKTDEEKRAHAETMFSYPKPGDAAAAERFIKRKTEANALHRDDIKTFVDLIDVDEKRR